MAASSSAATTTAWGKAAASAVGVRPRPPPSAGVAAGASRLTRRSEETSLDAIYHSGASMNLALPYRALRPVNVAGTREVLRLAASGRATPVHYVSTLSVLELVMERGGMAGRESSTEEAVAEYYRHSSRSALVDSSVREVGLDVAR